MYAIGKRFRVLFGTPYQNCVPSSADFGELLRHKTIKPVLSVIEFCHFLSIKKPMCFLMTSWN